MGRGISRIVKRILGISFAEALAFADFEKAAECVLPAAIRMALMRQRISEAAVKISGKHSSAGSFFRKGRDEFRRRFSLQQSPEKGGSREDRRPKPPRRPDRSLDPQTSGPTTLRHKVVVLGAPGTGKTAIINQFLYDKFITRYKRTIEEMHHGEFDVGGSHLSLQILDTSGANEFPAMRNLSIKSADGFILVYDVTDPATFEIVRDIRDQILETKGTETVPMVIVGNKSDLAKPVEEREFNANESVVTVDWEHGFVEASAKDNINIAKIFQELLRQAKVKYDLSPALRRRRRQSLPPSEAAGSSRGRPSGSSAGSSSHRAGGASTSQSHHSHQRRDKQEGTKRRSCITS